jgi:hypothetical protein
MERLHTMLIEDEIMLCGLVLVVGIVAGAFGRWAFNFTKGNET